MALPHYKMPRGLTAYEKQNCTPMTQLGLLYLRTMSDRPLLEAARGEGDGYEAVLHILGPKTNPTWITSQAAEEAYTRGLIDETEFDFLTR